MRMRWIAISATFLEEMSRKETMLGKCVDIMLTRTLADRLWSPFRSIAFSPVIALIVSISLYIVFCIVYIPLFLLSFLLTTYGSCLFVIFIIVLCARSLARTIAFPGSTMSLQRELSADFMRRLSIQLENFATDSANYTATLMLIISGRIPSVENSTMIDRLREIQVMAEILPRIAFWLERSQGLLANKSDIAVNDYAQISSLRRSIETLAKTLHELIPITSSALMSSDNHSTSNRGGSFFGSNVGSVSGGRPAPFTDSRTTNAVLHAAGRCLKASEDVKLTSIAIRPQKSEEEGIFMYVKSISKINSGPSGVQKFSFTIMREQIKHNFGAEGMSVAGPDGNRIDAIYIPCLSHYQCIVRSRPSSTSLGSGSLGGNEAGLLQSSPVSTISSGFCSEV